MASCACCGKDASVIVKCDASVAFCGETCALDHWQQVGAGGILDTITNDTNLIKLFVAYRMVHLSDFVRELHNAKSESRQLIWMKMEEAAFRRDLIAAFDYPDYQLLVDTMFLEACRHGYTQVAKALKSTRMGANPAVNKSEALMIVAQKGHLDMFRMLIEDPRIDKNTQKSEALKLACITGRTDIINLYPTNKYVVLHGQPMIQAIMKNYVDIVRKFVRTTYVSEDRQEAYFRIACQSAKLEIVKLLMQKYPHLRIPMVLLNGITSSISDEEHAKYVFEYLLQQYGEERIPDVQRLMRSASVERQTDIMKMLMVRGGDVTEDMLCLLLESGNKTEPVLLWLTSIDVADTQRVANAVARYGSAAMMRYILGQPRFNVHMHHVEVALENRNYDTAWFSSWIQLLERWKIETKPFPWQQ